MIRATPSPRRLKQPKPVDRHAAIEHPHAVPILHLANPQADEFETTFNEIPHDEYDPDLRHRMVSEAAYGRFSERGYQDGYDIEDWLRAEEDVDRQLLPGRHVSEL
jgi:Protein of unknown function (DUF2934)